MTDERKTPKSPKADKEKAAGKRDKEKEYGGRAGPEPTRYGDWENNGIASDF